jgi:hypothetical protein
VRRYVPTRRARGGLTITALLQQGEDCLGVGVQTGLSDGLCKWS